MNYFKILSIKVKECYSTVKSDFIFEIFFEIVEISEKNIDLKVVYINSPDKKDQDDELETFQIPAKKKGKFKILCKIKPPRFKNIKIENIIGANVILLTFLRGDKTLINVGYYIINEIPEIIEHFSLCHANLEKGKIMRKILEKEPRITHFFG